MKDATNIDYVPTENLAHVSHRVREWLLANVAPLLGPNPHDRRELDAYGGGNLYLRIGGYVPCPAMDNGEVSVETQLNIAQRMGATVLDPDGTAWTPYALHAEVCWMSSNLPAAAARLRLEMASRVLELAERFDAEVGDAVIWTSPVPKAVRDAQVLKHRRDVTRLKAAAHVKNAIHSTCRLMRVGDERFISAPEGDLLSGDYEVEVERKTYKVTIRDEGSLARFQFRRTK